MKAHWLGVLGVLLIMAPGCCPKITEEPPRVTAKSDTIRVFRTDTVVIPARVDSFTTTIEALRDSLEARGAITLTGEGGVSVTMEQDGDDLRIIAACDSLQAIIDSIETTTIIDSVTVEKTTVVTRYKKRKGKWWMWLLGGMVGGLVLAIAIRR